jgi:hypothetical protein
MHKSNALARQVHGEQKVSWSQKVRFDYSWWIGFCLFGSALGWALQMFFEKSLRSVLEENKVAVLTGPRIYFEYFWVYYFVLKIFSSYLIYSKNFSLLSLKDKAIQDLELCVSFFIEYRIVKYLFLTYDFKISGHCLILILGSYAIDTEGDLSCRLLENSSLKPLCKSLLILHYYFLTCTCAIYHSLLESFSGIILALTTIHLIKSLLSR